MSEVLFNQNLLVKYLQKPASEFTKEDIILYIEDHEVRMVNLRFVAEDGKLKTLNCMVTGHSVLENLLTYGERVNGSSIFSFLERNSSDIFIVPRFNTAFLNPFSEVPSLDILCSFHNADGSPLESAPGSILERAIERFTEQTGMEFKCMLELEYYVFSESSEDAHDYFDNHYMSSEPFTTFENLRIEALKLIAQCGGKIKFGHSERGRFIKNGKAFEQHELEFQVTSAIEAVDQLIISKWILRMLGVKHGATVTFIPKITLLQDGNGLHFHFEVEKEGVNQLVEKGQLTDVAKKMISGIIHLAPAISAFGNTIPVSYLRIMPGQNAPRFLCWGKGNRSTIVRIPSVQEGDNQTGDKEQLAENNQTIEYRGGDSSADIALFTASLIIAALYGFKDDKGADASEGFYCPENLYKIKDEDISYNQLPGSCNDAAGHLEKSRQVFEEGGVFTKTIINHTILRQRAFNDKDLTKNYVLYGENSEFEDMIQKYLHFM